MITVRRLALLTASVTVLATDSLHAQCPDGSPPPCARASRITAAPAPNSVAVLYLTNLSRDTADAYLADGLTEEIIIRLGQVARIDVKSRYEVQRVRNQATQEPTTLGRLLHAAYLVIGSVQRGGERVRLRYEIIRTATGARVGGDVIDRASDDLLTVESEIAQQVATAITGQLLPDERTRLARPLTSDAAAYEAYLRGAQALHSSYAEPSLRTALGWFDRAIARDSSFAAAFAAKAEVWAYLADAFVSPVEAYGQARLASATALALDSSQALAYSMLAVSVLTLDLDTREAERLARRALAVNPRDDQAHLVLYWSRLLENRPDEGVDEARRAWLADSLVSANGNNFVEALIYDRRLDSAAAMVPRLRLILPPADVDAVAAMLLAAQGHVREAGHLVNWRYYGGLYGGLSVRALLAAGDTTGARATVDSMLMARRSGYYNPVALARAYAALGNVDEGIAWLQRAIEERTQFVTYLYVDEELAPLRADPRYAALLAGIARTR